MSAGIRLGVRWEGLEHPRAGATVTVTATLHNASDHDVDQFRTELPLQAREVTGTNLVLAPAKSVKLSQGQMDGDVWVPGPIAAKATAMAVLEARLVTQEVAGRIGGLQGKGA